MHLLLVWLGAISLFGQTTPPAPEEAKPEPEQMVEEIIAKVNGKIITRADLDRDRELLIESVKRQQMPDDQAAKILKDTEPNLLRNKIDDFLLVQRAEQLDIKVDTEVTKYLSRIMLDYRIADQDKLAQLVREQTGMRFEDFRDNIKNDMLKQRVLGGEVGSQIHIAHADVEKYYNEHQSDFVREERVYLQEILIAADQIGDEEAKKKADDIVERARRGERFDELARANSDSQTKDDGGVLSPYKKGDMRPEFEALIWDQPKNYVTDPYKLSNGNYLILKVVAHHQAGVAAIEEVENEIMNRLMEPLFAPLQRQYLTELRRDAFLQIKDGWVDTGAAPGKDTTWKDPVELTPETIEKSAVLADPGHKRLLWIVPIPGSARAPTSSSR